MVTYPDAPADLIRRLGRVPFDLPYLFGCAILALFAFTFNWLTGHRGIFLLDQSMIFDGGWRILQGQTPYLDFLMPFGPVTFYVQALFFRMFGVNWSAMVLPACLFNVFATLSVIRIVRLLSGGSRTLALFGGLATAICFQAPIGTLWLEQTAMFFDLLALQAVVESFSASGYRRRLWLVAAGFLLVVAVLSKQNYGMFFIPIVFGASVAGDLPDIGRACRSPFFLAAGITLSIALFGVWVYAFSDPFAFVHGVFAVAGEIGRKRLGLGSLVRTFSFATTPNWFQIDLLGILVGGAALYLASFNIGRPLWRQTAPACVIAILLPVFRSLTLETTLNEWQNDSAFLGLTVCLSVGILLQIMRYVSIVPVAQSDINLRLPSARIFKIGFLVVVGLWGALVLGYEVTTAWRRTVQQFENGAVFTDTIRVRGLDHVRWGEPTLIGPATTLRRTDFENLAAYLSLKRSAFFVMGDSTILYGLLGYPSPQPLLYFLPSHSFLRKEIPQLDPIIVTSLERNKVKIVIREKVTYLPRVYDAYPQFPLTWAWFTSQFEHTADFGNYEVWEKRPAAPR